MTKLVFGVGFNDGSRPTKIDGKKVKEYALWQDMLERCFSEKLQTRYQTYKGCSVSTNFLNYSFFYDWCKVQIGFRNVDENGRSWCLDKDILFKYNKLYSEDTCAFVPNEINSFFTDNGKNRGNYPVGVSLPNGYTKYVVTVCVVGKNKYLGGYNTIEEAFAVYKKHKEALCKELALKWKDEIDPRVYEAMMKWEVSITS